MSGTEKNIGQHEMKISDVLGDVAEKATASVSHAMHPLVERYAQILFGSSGRCKAVSSSGIRLFFLGDGETLQSITNLQPLYSRIRRATTLRHQQGIGQGM
jgi:hypothetical protein